MRFYQSKNILKSVRLSGEVGLCEQSGSDRDEANGEGDESEGVERLDGGKDDMSLAHEEGGEREKAVVDDREGEKEREERGEEESFVGVHKKKNRRKRKRSASGTIHVRPRSLSSLPLIAPSPSNPHFPF
jgi:hypothetical protein